MRLKRYVVDSMPDALQRIRADLGNDAVILNTKEIRSGGFLGLFSKKRFEVIAATDSAVTPPRNNPSYEVQPESTNATVTATSDQPARRTAVSVLERSEPQTAQPVMPAMEPKQQDELLQEVRQMKEMLLKFSANAPNHAFHDICQQVKHRLLEQEIMPAIVDELLANALADMEEDSGANHEEAFCQHIRNQLLTILRKEGHSCLNPDTKIAHFVGPTGVGKTTTIAKLAAEQVLKHNRKVGFITSDTYRIAAVEQLKTYANILNVPLEVVFSPQEMSKAFHSLADRDLIFMDTAGRNFRSELYVSELNAMLQNNSPSETFLVLSLTSKYKDMKAITANFTKFKVDKVLFTKADETESLGSIINLAYEFQIRGSYITNGQNVPEDIEEIKEERIVDLIMGGIGYE